MLIRLCIDVYSYKQIFDHDGDDDGDNYDDDGEPLAVTLVPVMFINVVYGWC